MMRLRRQQGVAWLAPLAGTLLACSSQVESDYRGEPIATMHGVVSTRAELDSIPDVSAAIVWLHADSQPRMVGERIDVTDSFPASFTLNLYGPPPSEAEVTDSQDWCVSGSQRHGLIEGESCAGQVIPKGTGLGLWMGYLAAIRADAPDGEISRSDIVGIDVDHMLVYYTRGSDDPLPPMPSLKDLAANTVSVGNADSTHQAGYTLLKKNPEFEAIDQADRDCTWQDGCVHWLASPGPLHDFFQEFFEWELERCLQRFPENSVCTARSIPTLEDWVPVGPEDAASIECRQNYEILSNACSTITEVRPYTELSGDGLDDPIAIQLGLGIWDAAPLR